MTEFKIGNSCIGDSHPTYFIADISANHDGSLDRALKLITLAKQAGADCAKFQHFRAKHIVSKYGFESMGKLAHQAGWKEDVYSAFERLSIDWNWTPFLKAHCKKIGIEFMSTPYDMEAVDHLEPYVNAYKIGSGDITYHQLIKYAASKGKPLLIATGASSWKDVHRVDKLLGYRQHSWNNYILMQCNTNYTGKVENSSYANLSALVDLSEGNTVGLSDHTTNHTTVLGAVALGARVIEKHFTDDRTRVGPDHAFSLESTDWQSMVRKVREMEATLGDGVKKVEENERETVILQRRACRAAADLKKGTQITKVMVEYLRSAPEGSFPPYEIEDILGKTLTEDMVYGEHFTDRLLQ